jgi:hypothetical protein
MESRYQQVVYTTQTFFTVKTTLDDMYRVVEDPSTSDDERSLMISKIIFTKSLLSRELVLAYGADRQLRYNEAPLYMKDAMVNADCRVGIVSCEAHLSGMPPVATLRRDPLDMLARLSLASASEVACPVIPPGAAKPWIDTSDPIFQLDDLFLTGSIEALPRAGESV